MCINAYLNTSNLLIFQTRILIKWRISLPDTRIVNVFASTANIYCSQELNLYEYIAVVLPKADMVRTLQYKYICIHILITVVVIVYSIHGNQKFRSSILETEIEKCFNDHYTIVDLDYGAISMCGLYCMQDTNCTVACYNADTRTCLLNDKRRSHLQKTHCEHCALLWKDKG